MIEVNDDKRGASLCTYQKCRVAADVYQQGLAIIPTAATHPMRCSGVDF